MYKLYWARNSAAFAPEVILELGGLPYERLPIDLSREENRAADYLAVNPAGYVPALITPDGAVIFESAAIVLYLCDRHALDLVPPVDASERGSFYRTLFYMTNTVQEACKLYYYPARFAGSDAELETTKARALDLLHRRWAVVEDILSAGDGPFFAGEQLGALDVYMVMLVTWHPDQTALLADFPAIQRCFTAACGDPVLARVLDRHGEA